MVDDDSRRTLAKHILTGGMAIKITPGNCHKYIAGLYLPGIVGNDPDIAICNTVAFIFSQYIK